MKREVVPAIGCTEPVAVSLCVARATELLGTEPEHITARLSANILKNAMGVGIPATGMIGLPIAIALGALVGRSEYELEVLKDADSAAVERGKQYIAQERITIELKKGITEKLYVEIEAVAADHRAVAVIAGGHTSFVYLMRDDEVLLDVRGKSGDEEQGDDVELSLRKVYDFAMTAPLDEIEFIRESMHLNKAAAESAFVDDYGHSLGRMLRQPRELKIMGDSVFSRILSYTASAEEREALKHQQRLPDAATIDLALSKRFRLTDTSTLNLQLSVRNILGSNVIYSSYEENRISLRKVGSRTDVSPFANRLSYAYPRLFTLSASLRF
jgi:L-cysteine desulfidase